MSAAIPSIEDIHPKDRAGYLQSVAGLFVSACGVYIGDGDDEKRVTTDQALALATRLIVAAAQDIARSQKSKEAKS